MMRFIYFALVISASQVSLARYVVSVDPPGKVGEADARPFSIMPGPFMGSKKKDTAAEDSDDAEYNSMEGPGNPEGSGSSENLLEQAMIDMVKHATDQQDPPVQKPDEDSDNGGPLFEYKPMEVPTDSDESSDNEDRFRKLIEQARILRLLNRIRMMQEMTNGGPMGPPMMRPMGAPMMPQQPVNPIDDQANGQLMDMMRPNGFGGPMRPIDPQDVIMDSAQGEPLDDSFPGAPQERSGGVAVIFVPVWRIIERTVFFVSKEPSDQASTELVIDNGPADFLFGLVLGLLGVAFAFVLTITILKFVRGRRERAVFNKAPLFSPPAYAQPHLTTLPTTKLEGATSSEKPPLDANKV